MAFHEVRFPEAIGRGARGGPERRTQVVELASGDEERNAGCANSRRRYDVMAAGGAAGLAPRGGASAISGGAAAVRGGASAAGAASAAYSLGSLGQSGAAGVASGLGGVARAAGGAAAAPLRRAAQSVRSSFADGVKSGFGATGGSSSMGTVANDVGSAAPAATGSAGSPPAWAQRMRRGQTMSHGVTLAAHAIRSGDSHGGGSSINLSGGDRT